MFYSHKKKNRSRTPKKLSQNRHFKKRLFERFEINIEQKDIEKIKYQIESGQSAIIKRQSNRIVLHGVKINDTYIIIVYDKLRKQPVTVIPKEDEKYGN